MPQRSSRKPTRVKRSSGADRKQSSRLTGSKAAGSRAAGSRATGSRAAGARGTDARVTGSRATGAKESAAKASGSRVSGSTAYGSRSTDKESSKPRVGKRLPAKEPEPQKKRKPVRKPGRRPAPKVVPTNAPLVIKNSRPPLTQLTPADRKALKAKAHHLNPVVQVGKHLVTDKLIAEVSQALEHHELIKVKFVEGKLERAELAKDIATKSNGFLVAMIGNIAILFREQQNQKKRKIWW